MALKNPNRNSLSKSILEMKFMKRTKDRVEKQTYQKEGEEFFGNIGVPKKTGRFITEASYAFCEELIEGRLSFHGENPEIERIMELEALENAKKIIKKDENDDKDITDDQMAKMWQTTHKINVKNIEMKSEKKKNSNDDIGPKNKRFKFMKPSEDL